MNFVTVFLIILLNKLETKLRIDISIDFFYKKSLNLSEHKLLIKKIHKKSYLCGIKERFIRYPIFYIPFMVSGKVNHR